MAIQMRQQRLKAVIDSCANVSIILDTIMSKLNEHDLLDNSQLNVCEKIRDM